VTLATMTVVLLTFATAELRDVRDISVDRAEVPMAVCLQTKADHHLSKPNSTSLVLVSCVTQE